MKKSKFMIGALVLSMGLLGTGYAYWTDALSISAAVSTGKLEVVASQTNGVEPQYIYTEDNSQVDGENVSGGDKFNVSIKDEGISVELPNMHPGTKVVIPYTITNNSTMPIIGTVGGVTTGQTGLLNMLDVKLYRGNDEISLKDKEIDTFGEKISSLLKEAYSEDDKLAGNYKLEIIAPGDLKEEFTEGVKGPLPIGFNVAIDWTQHNNPTVNPKIK